MKTRELNSPTLDQSVAVPAPSGGSALRDKKVYTIQGWRRWALTPLTTALVLWSRTIRFETSESTLRSIGDFDQPIVFIPWHNRLFLVPEIVRRYRGKRPLYALISASKDGAWLADFFSLVGIQSIRGSSSRFGREAVTALVEELRTGHDIGITPDGPRGPQYDFKAGALIVARRVKAPMVAIGIAFESAWQLSSWDEFYIPKPFSRVRFVSRTLQAHETKGEGDATARIKTLLTQINPDPAPKVAMIVI